MNVKLSIVVPFYNEAKNIRPLYEALFVASLRAWTALTK